jgi:hypothetical protein
MGKYKQLVLSFLSEAETDETTIVALISDTEYVVIIPNPDSQDILSATFIQIDIEFLQGYKRLYEMALAVK